MGKGLVAVMQTRASGDSAVDKVCVTLLITAETCVGGSCALQEARQREQDAYFQRDGGYKSLFIPISGMIVLG